MAAVLPPNFADRYEVREVLGPNRRTKRHKLQRH